MSQRAPFRVLIAAPLYPPEIGGPATYVALLERELPQYDCSVTVLPFAQVRAAQRGVRHYRYFRLLLAALRGADCLYALDPVSVGLVAWLATLVARKPLVLRIAGDYAWEQGTTRFHVRESLDLFARRKLHPHPLVCALKLVQTVVALGAQRIIVPSQYLRRVVCLWGVTPGKVLVIYNGVDPFPQLPQRDELRRNLGFTGRVIISAGRLVPWKGFAALITVLADIVKVYPETRLVIAGDGPDASLLRAHAAACGVDEQVRFVGRVSRDELARALTAADLFVLNSFYEGFSHLIIEAMLASVPVVVTAVGGNPELIRDGETGRLVPYNDRRALYEAILAILSGYQDGGALARRAREYAQHFSHRAMLAEVAPALMGVV